jgi:hypothetical protein
MQLVAAWDSGSGLRSRWSLGWLAMLLAVAAGGWWVAAPQPGGGEPAQPRESLSSRSLLSLPVSAREPVSATIGGADRAFRVRGGRALNPKQGFRLRFGTGGVVVRSGRGRLILGLSGRGRPRTSRNRVVYGDGPVREWFVNGPVGLEQGFDVVKRPRYRRPLEFSIPLAGVVRARLDGSARAMLVLAGGGSLRYSGLSTTDARGRLLRSWLTASRGRLSIHVDDAGARYPLRVDPYIQQGSKLVGTGIVGTYADQGFSVALSADGNTALVGGWYDNSNVGAAWVFVRSGGVWTQQAKLVASGAVGASDQGYSVALSSDGNTALVGGYGDNTFVGAAWVFTRSGTTWSQQGSKLVGTGATGAAEQGRSVALSGDGNTALIGGPADNSGAGAAWVFVRSNGAWSQQGSKIVAGDAIGSAEQGRGTALSYDGNTALIGGADDNSGVGATWAFVRSGGTWSEQAKLVGTGAAGAGSQGLSVALSGDGDTALIGGPFDNSDAGAAWVFTRSGTSWSQQGSKLVGSGMSGSIATQGWSVALSEDGDTAAIGGPDDGYNNQAFAGPGAGWVFTRAGNGTFTQDGSKLFGSGPVGYAQQGWSVALSLDGSTVLVAGAYDNNGTGAVWVFQNQLAPTVSGVSPGSGPADGGTQVTITGSGFTGASGVDFGSPAAAAYEVDSDTQITATTPPGAGTVDVTVTAAGGTSAANAGDIFVYLPAPSVITGAASSVSLSAALLTGVVNPSGVTVPNCHFDWGTSAAYGSTVPCGQAVGSGSNPVPVSAALSGLSPNTTYHFRVVATSAGGTGVGADEVFATGPLLTTSLSLACSPRSVLVGQASTCAVTVSGSGGVPSGTVSFASGGSGGFGTAGTCMLAGSGGSASCSVLYTPTAVGSGTHTITTRYAGDAMYAGSTGTTTVTVSLAVKRATSIAVACSPGMVAPGSSTSCMVTVTDVAGGAPAPPSGVVNFVESGGPGVGGGGSCVLSGTGGSSSCAVTYTVGGSAVGTYMISAVYGGDGTYAGGAALTSFAVSASAGVAATVQVVAGTVLIRESSGAFVPLGGSTVSVPIGSEVDARKGVVRLVTAADYLPARDRRHRVQTGTFSVAIFAVKQLTIKQALARARAQHKRRLTGMPSTDLQLMTPSGALAKARCRRTGPPGKGIVRAFAGSGKGLYRTIGASSITTVRNATWIVRDRCDGTLTEVGRGSATVTPTHGKNPRPVTVRSGQGVLIKGRFA